MIDIPGIYVGRFKTDPNNRPALMTRAAAPTYTNDNWANVESTGTIWRYNAETGEWVDTGLEEILVEEVSGTKEIVAEGTVPWNLQGLSVYGKSTQQTTTGAQLFDISQASPARSAYGLQAKISGEYVVLTGTVAAGSAGTHAFKLLNIVQSGIPGTVQWRATDVSGTSLGAIQLILREGELLCKCTIPTDGTSVSTRFRVMASVSGVEAWEPYTNGQASPSPAYPQPINTAGASGGITVTVSDGADQSQQLSISTPNGLPGIPVDSGGNFTDETGQQWVCDEVDFEKGVYVRRTSITNYDGTEDWMTWGVNNLVDGLTGFYCYFDSDNNNALNALNTLLEQNDSVWGGGEEGFNCSSPGMSQYIICTLPNDFLEDTSTNELAVQSWKNILATIGMTAIFTLVNPIETPLSEEELAAYAALMSYDGSTVISTDEDVSGISAKVVTDVISKNAWFDPYVELALYYKALAGFASLEDLPMPHSRESSLVRKLLNSSYELGFTVTENSSRNERYLWDLINGTTSMLTNVPKSDTEKFLHVMIGGSVEEYPTVDTELDYWMDKCVNYMSSNGSIGE